MFLIAEFLYILLYGSFKAGGGEGGEGKGGGTEPRDRSSWQSLKGGERNYMKLTAIKRGS